MKLKCIAIDDEPLALELLSDNISQLPFLQLVAGFNKPLEAIQYLQENEVDLVLLDIQMPGITGLQLIQRLSVKPLFILVTAYEQFALQGFDLEVVDYLLKPVRQDRFNKACLKALEIYQLKQQQDNSQEAVRDYMFIQADYMMVRINFEDLLWVEGLKDYVKFHFDHGQKPLVARMSMKSLEENLASRQFLRIHKSYIVSKRAITAVQRNNIFIQEICLPVGDLYREQVQAFVGI